MIKFVALGLELSKEGRQSHLGFENLSQIEDILKSCEQRALKVRRPNIECVCALGSTGM